ncbi:hypothetical protein [Geotalea sp. SG265]|uniref:hypothetical protein n=1 Tax=Geotalea sp. SG265 TaxID=2922867 RepID=UPI001FB011FF|nr:hypothetical protein [Geotalea sp. SG265]
MPGSVHSNGQIPPLFFVILIAYGVIHILAGSYRWPWFLENPRLARFFRRFFVFSTEEGNDYAAAFSILAGIVSIITGVLGLVLL